MDASREAIGKYERNEAVPSVGTAKNIADVFDVSLDYLVGEGVNAFFDKKTVKRLRDIHNLDQETCNMLFRLIDTVLRDTNAKKASHPKFLRIKNHSY
ncbi:helix-turn-helix transcriptional regulator [Costertonia aggregata]|uniref:Helix-turn-helix transcriptional regulator n=1 Tax=Costertonia aggregata TaxID=343403 RepID=A0A7H9AUZ7_9FLAO|nr:helix-turn-helix transcriptional regulator [Costertonia aggregata]